MAAAVQVLLPCVYRWIRISNDWHLRCCTKNIKKETANSVLRRRRWKKQDYKQIIGSSCYHVFVLVRIAIDVLLPRQAQGRTQWIFVCCRP